MVASRSSSPASLEVVDVGEHDLGEVDLEQVDLLLQHQREEQVERALEDLQVEVQRGGAHCGRKASAGGPDAHRAARTSASVSEAIARALSAPARSDALELGLVGAQLLVALADRRQVVDDRLGHRALERRRSRSPSNSCSISSGAAPRITPTGCRSGS